MQKINSKDSVFGRVRIASAVLLGVGLLGMSMPGCPGGALQTQVDTLQASNADLTKKVQTLTTQLGGMGNDMTQVKSLLAQMTALMTAQKTTVDQLETKIKELESKSHKKKR